MLTGEHGVGVEKRDLMPVMFSEADLEQQQRLKCAFDDKGLLNPGKVFPTLHRCAELGRMHVHAGGLAVPNSAILPRSLTPGSITIMSSPADESILKPRDAGDVEQAVRWALAGRQGA